jgi:hypothetical protein
MNPGQFELILVQAKDDLPPFSAEYQKELRQFSTNAHASSQQGFAMDSMLGGGGPIGDFTFNDAVTLIKALTPFAVAWVTARYGRKLKLKYRDPQNGEVQIEANTLAEVEAMVKIVENLKNN